MKEIDARGLACPAPVLHTKAALEEENVTSVKVVVDSEASQQNVQRFLETSGFAVSLNRQGDDFIIIGNSSGPLPQRAESIGPEKTERKKIMVLCATDRIGFGDDELGLKLMISFIKTLKEMGPELWRLVFVNYGVKLAVDESEVLPVLQEYEKEGLHILVCGTCLTHFNLLERKKVGETTNMLDIVTAMQLADKVITV